MIPGQEREHFRSLLRQLTRRGTSVVFRSCDEVLTYPAHKWLWSPLSKWSWSHEDHINVYEILSALHFLRLACQKPEMHGCRCFHVVDSSVAQGVLSKGRSSVRKFNTFARRSAAMQVASDLYWIVLWTISRWQWADADSRDFAPV